MIAHPKISRMEWKTAEIGAFEVGKFALFSCPVVGLVVEVRDVRAEAPAAQRREGRVLLQAGHARGAVGPEVEGAEPDRQVPRRGRARRGDNARGRPPRGPRRREGAAGRRPRELVGSPGVGARVLRRERRPAPRLAVERRLERRGRGPRAVPRAVIVVVVVVVVVVGGETRVLTRVARGRSNQVLICGILTEVGKHRVTDVLIKTSQVVLSRMVNLKPVSIKESVELGVDKRLRSNFIVAIYVIELVFSVSHS